MILYLFKYSVSQRHFFNLPPARSRATTVREWQESHPADFNPRPARSRATLRFHQCTTNRREFQSTPCAKQGDSKFNQITSNIFYHFDSFLGQIYLNTFFHYPFLFPQTAFYALLQVRILWHFHVHFLFAPPAIS